MRFRRLLAFLFVAVATQTSAEQEVRIKDCEYLVTFPTQPRVISYQSESKPGEFFITRSEDGTPILRAECQKITDRSGLSEALTEIFH